jgi:hypothetical protein
MLYLTIFMSFRMPNQVRGRMSNAWSESDSHYGSKRQRISISSLTDMSDEAAPPRSFDELMDATCDCLEPYLERGMDDKVERKIQKNAFTESNSSRFQALVARFEKAIQTHDTRLAASTVALAALLPVAYSGNIQERNSKPRRQQGMQHLSCFLRFQQIPLAKRRCYAMKIQRHSQATSERA